MTSTRFLAPVGITESVASGQPTTSRTPRVGVLLSLEATASECVSASWQSRKRGGAGSAPSRLGWNRRRSLAQTSLAEPTIGMARGCRVITVSSGGFKTICGWLRISLVVVRRDKPAWSCCERERRRQDVVRDGGPADCGAVEVMEVVWPSGAALRGEASNRPQVHWLKTVVLNVVGKGAARSRQVGVGKMSDGRESSAVDVSKAGKTTSKPGLLLRPGMSLGGARLLPRRRPAYRQHDPDRGASMERVKACLDTAAVPSAARGRSPSGRIREELSTVAGCAGGLARSSCEASAYRSGSWSEGAGSSRRAGAVNRKG